MPPKLLHFAFGTVSKRSWPFRARPAEERSGHDAQQRTPPPNGALGKLSPFERARRRTLTRRGAQVATACFEPSHLRAALPCRSPPPAAASHDKFRAITALRHKMIPHSRGRARIATARRVIYYAERASAATRRRLIFFARTQQRDFFSPCRRARQSLLRRDGRGFIYTRSRRDFITTRAACLLGGAAAA